MDTSLLDKNDTGLSRDAIAALLKSYFRNNIVKGRILVIPPDQSRLYSGAGMITNIIWELCRDAGLGMDVMPALGTHEAMIEADIRMFFGNIIPRENFFVHNWRTGVRMIGEIPAEFVRDVSQGIMDMPIRVEVNNRIVSGDYAAILSVGQILPHEVTGFANYTKNILVGVGGSDFINKTHYLGAVVGTGTWVSRNPCGLPKKIRICGTICLWRRRLSRALRRGALGLCIARNSWANPRSSGPDSSIWTTIGQPAFMIPIA
jgi:hypothetical protein